MKSFAPLLVLLAGLLASSQARERIDPHAPPQIQCGGKEYVRLIDWARANDLGIRWLKTNESLELDNHSCRIQLTVGSCETRINGVRVLLSLPVAPRNGTVYISDLDLRTTLQPILSPPKISRQGSIKSICLDPGHGGKDPGYCVGTTEEKKCTLRLAQEVCDQLTHAGFKVFLTRDTDSTVDLPARPELARRVNADLFVSLHFNAINRAETSSASAHGTQVYCLTPAGAESTNDRGGGGGGGSYTGNQCNARNVCLAYQVQKSLTRELETEDQGVRRARYEVLCNAAMPAVLIEAGYLSHPAEGRKILDPTYRRQIARAIVDGLVAYKRWVEPTGERTATRAPKVL
jgi:N-acetylmuramoyl-L-alanine amidase